MWRPASRIKLAGGKAQGLGCLPLPSPFFFLFFPSPSCKAIRTWSPVSGPLPWPLPPRLGDRSGKGFIFPSSETRTGPHFSFCPAAFAFEDCALAMLPSRLLRRALVTSQGFSSSASSPKAFTPLKSLLNCSACSFDRMLMKAKPRLTSALKSFGSHRKSYAPLWLLSRCPSSSSCVKANGTSLSMSIVSAVAEGSTLLSVTAGSGGGAAYSTGGYIIGTGHM
mmetsp:Transcript_17373/g.46007  ORF Transcript_17373/g.46007 Transcript_17373/m.46007 type:complete len:223 (-) Transcript_17373:387-1055(-)